MTTEDSYHRESVRVDLTKHQRKLYYKFVSLDDSFVCKEIYTAKVLDLSETGAQICGTLPSLRLMNLLGTEKIYIGCVFPINSLDENAEKDSIKFLSRIRWAQSEAHEGANCHRMGLEFTKISTEDRSLLKNYLIRMQLRAAKVNRTLELLNPDN